MTCIAFIGKRGKILKNAFPDLKENILQGLIQSTKESLKKENDLEYIPTVTEVKNYLKKTYGKSWTEIVKKINFEDQTETINTNQDIDEEEKSTPVEDQTETINTNQDIDEEEKSTPVEDLTRNLSILEAEDILSATLDPETRLNRVNYISHLFSKFTEEILEAEKKKLNDLINDENTLPDEKKELLEQLKNLNKLTILKQYNPYTIFEKIKKYFTDYAEANTDELVEIAVNNKIKNNPNLANKKEYLLEQAKKTISYRQQEFNKMIKDDKIFEALCKETTYSLVFSEGIFIDFNKISTQQVDFTNNGENITNTDEKPTKEHWQYNLTEISSHNSLSIIVRNFLSNIPKLNIYGKYVYDDLYNNIYLDANYTHMVLLNGLMNMMSAEDMMPMLEELSKTQLWVKQVIKELNKDEQLIAAFYSDMRKDYLNFWIQKIIKEKDGTIKTKTINLNKPETISFVLQQVQDNIQQGNMLNNSAIYNDEGNLRKDYDKVVQEHLDKTGELLFAIRSTRHFELSVQMANDIQKLLESIGFIVPDNFFEICNTTNKYNNNKNYNIFLRNLDIIFRAIKNNGPKIQILRNDIRLEQSINDTYKKQYFEIAKVLAQYTQNCFEQCIRENNKSHYAHTAPNYINKLIKNLQGIMGVERFNKFIEDEFGQYEWFKNTDGTWNNLWIELLVKNPKLREELKLKQVLNRDKIEYTDFSDLDYLNTILQEFDMETIKGESSGFANYYVPIEADAPCCEFIKFVRFTDDDYQEKITEGLRRVVLQEFNRILLVERRADDSNTTKLDNFDSTEKSKGGAEFKFMPALNNAPGIWEEKTFLDTLKRLKLEKNNDSLIRFIDHTINDVMEDGFNSDLEKWKKMGLLKETKDNKNVFLSQYKSMTVYNRELNKTLYDIKNILEANSFWTKEMENFYYLVYNNLNYNYIYEKTIKKNILGNLIYLLSNNKITTEAYNNIKNKLNKENETINFLKNYYWNNTLAQTQIIELLTTDLAFYKDLYDFQKRAKEWHTPGNRLYTLATYKGVLVGRKYEHTIYIKDEYMKSNSFEYIEKALNDFVKDGRLSVFDRDIILTKFKNVNVTDAQAYRSISSYKAIMHMKGLWNDETEAAFNRFENNEWDMSDFNIIWQTIKPFVYTKQAYEDKTNGVKIKTPIQHKNSEFLLLATYNLLAQSLNKSGKLKAINKFMENQERPIDVVQFTSAVKVGGRGAIDLTGIEDENEVLKRLEEHFYTNGDYNYDNVTRIPYEDYSIVASTPEHGIDCMIDIGTQFVKLITTDMSNDPNYKIKVNDIEMTKQEWLDHFNSIFTENIIEKFTEVNEIFKDPKNIEKILQEEIRRNPNRYERELIAACTLNADGKFNIPLLDPTICNNVQSLLNSIIKKRITKQKFRGGQFVQVSNYGLTDSLNIVFKNKEGEILTKEDFFKKNENATEEDFKKFIEDSMKSGELSMAHMEAYMPCTSREFFKYIMDENGKLDIDKLPEELRKAVGYRVPTEDKYSMIPIYIKGFLPQQNGSAIMLPSEITTITGSDFDVDKLYVLLPEFKKGKNINYKKVYKDFYEKYKKIFEKEGASLADVKILYKNNNAIKTQIDEFIEKNRDKYAIESLKKINYNFKDKPQNQSRFARNNAIIDLAFSALTTPDILNKMLKPGNFDVQERTKYVIDLLNAYNKKELIDKIEEIKPNLDINNKSINEIIKSLSDKELKLLWEKLNNNLNPLSNTTQILFHQQNMVGNDMIGATAVHNVGHGLFQQTDISIKDDFSFVLFEKEYKKLNEVKNKEGEYITSNNASWIQSSVDNTKKPTLATLNINNTTVNTALLLSRLGYNPYEIGVFLNQPIIKEITNAILKKEDYSINDKNIINDIIKKYTKASGSKDVIKYDKKWQYKFPIDALVNNIIKNKEENKSIRFYKAQTMIGLLFDHILNVANELSEINKLIRTDTSGGTIGSTASSVIEKIETLKTYNKKIEPNENGKIKSVFENSKILKDDLYTNDIDILRKRILKSKLPIIQAYYTLGIESVPHLYEQYLPLYRKDFIDVIDTITAYSNREILDDNTIQDIYKNLFIYIMTSLPFFGKDSINRVSNKQQREYFIKQFANDFKSFKEKYNIYCNNNIFLNNLSYNKPNRKYPFSSIKFNNIGSLTEQQKEEYRKSWQEMVYSEEPEVRKMAYNLIKYCFYRNGFDFSPKSFINLMNILLKTSIPGYTELLQKTTDHINDFSHFIEQYVENHLYDKQFCTETSESLFEKNDDNFYELKDPDESLKQNPSLVDYIIKTDDVEISVSRKYLFFHSKNEIIYLKKIGKNMYKEITPKGFRNNALEYEFGVSVDDMESVIYSIDETNDETPNPKNDDQTDEADDETPKPKNDSQLSFAEIMKSEIKKEIEDQSGIKINGEQPINTDPKSTVNFKPNEKAKEDDNTCGIKI